ncbi:hypothetical protein K449DRAFT_465547 [Hypoxylon sp. EC38]|nr:hypothetical protein K449DRAFT_465547 [Hypoxylon sp. EC38]
MYHYYSAIIPRLFHKKGLPRSAISRAIIPLDYSPSLASYKYRARESGLATILFFSSSPHSLPNLIWVSSHWNFHIEIQTQLLSHISQHLSSPSTVSFLLFRPSSSLPSSIILSSLIPFLFIIVVMYNYHPSFVTLDPQHSTFTFASITTFVAIIVIIVVVVVVLFGDNPPSPPLLHHHGLQTPSPFKIGHAIWKYLYSFLPSHIARLASGAGQFTTTNSSPTHTHFFADASFTHAYFLPHTLFYNYLIFQVISCKVSYKELKKPCVRLEFETTQSQPANPSGGKPSEINGCLYCDLIQREGRLLHNRPLVLGVMEIFTKNLPSNSSILCTMRPSRRQTNSSFVKLRISVIFSRFGDDDTNNDDSDNSSDGEVITYKMEGTSQVNPNPRGEGKGKPTTGLSNYAHGIMLPSTPSSEQRCFQE